MTTRTTQRPQAFAKPARWSDAPPPVPEETPDEADNQSPTRYGDWVKNGIAIDF